MNLLSLCVSVSIYYPNKASHAPNSLLFSLPTPCPPPSHYPQEVPFHATKFAVFDAVSSALKASFLYSSSVAAASSSSAAATAAAAISILSG